MTQTIHQQYDANALLMGGGTGSPAWKFDQPCTKTGTITAPPVARQERDYDPNNPGGGNPKFFPSGDPIMGIHVEVQTDERDPSNAEDTGVRTFYIEGRYLKDAVRTAVRNAGAPGLEVGGRLVVQFTHREDPMDKRSRKYWQVQYTPAGNAALMADPQPAQQPAQAAPAPQQQPVSAPVPAPTPTAVQRPASVPEVVWNTLTAEQQAATAAAAGGAPF